MRIVIQGDARPPGPADAVTSQRIASALQEEILAGDLPPGTWLRQDEIAVRFAASRQPVREALRILVTEGLIELSPNRGARVPTLRRQDVNTLYQMRERLETLTLVESLAYLTDAEIAGLETIQDAIERNADVRRFLVLDREFHLASYAACPSEQLRSATIRLWNATQHYRRAFVLLQDPDRAWIINAEHRLLLDALRRRDPEDAERLLVGHLRRPRIELNRHPELFGSS